MANFLIEEVVHFMIQIHWQLFLRVRTADKAKAVVGGCAKVLANDSSVVECQRYWKDKSLFRVLMTSPVVAAEVPAAVMETLQACSALAGRWVVSSPQFYEGNEWEFSGSADSPTISIPGVTHIDFQVGSLRKQGSAAGARHEKVGT